MSKPHALYIFVYLATAVIHKPEIHTCRMGAESALGEAANTTSVGNSTSCSDTGDGFINFVPDHLYFNLDVMFLLPESIPEPIDGFNDYAKMTQFGIIASYVSILKHRTDGMVKRNSLVTLLFILNFDFFKLVPSYDFQFKIYIPTLFLRTKINCSR